MGGWTAVCCVVLCTDWRCTPAVMRVGGLQLCCVVYRLAMYARSDEGGWTAVCCVVYRLAMYARSDEGGWTALCCVVYRLAMYCIVLCCVQTGDVRPQ